MAEIILQSRKEQIRQVAQNMFRDRGFAATSMRDLAGAVGIEPASLYSHIKSKEQILNSICMQMAEEFMDANSGIEVLNYNPEVKLKKAINNHLQVVMDNADAAAVFFHDWKFLTGENLEKFKSKQRNYEWIFQKIVTEGVEKGQFKNKHIKFTVNTIFSSINWIWDWYSPAGQVSPQEMKENLIEYVVNGIKAHNS